MASQPADPAIAPRLYLVTAPLADPAAVAPRLAAAVAEADVAAVLLRLADTDERTLIKRVKAIAPALQERGVAVVLADRPEIVARSGADGAHLNGIDAFTAAVAGLKPDRIAGAGSLPTRHDAMLAGEAGADYVMFGEPDAHGHLPPPEAVTERIAWWAEVFQPPCVGYAADLDMVARLAAAGADFIALADSLWVETSVDIAAAHARRNTTGIP